MNDINKFHAKLPQDQYYELGNLMAKTPDTSALLALNWRINAMREDLDGAIEALKDIEAIYLEGNDDREDKNAMGTIAKNFLFYRGKHSG